MDIVPNLLNQKKTSMSPLYEKILAHIFNKFDVDKDGALNSTEFDAYGVATNGEPFDKAALKDIMAKVDLDKNGNLTLKGFIYMYTCQCIADPDETWKDLSKHGYSYEMIANSLMLKKPIIPHSKK